MLRYFFFGNGEGNGGGFLSGKHGSPSSRIPPTSVGFVYERSAGGMRGGQAEDGEFSRRVGNSLKWIKWNKKNWISFKTSKD